MLCTFTVCHVSPKGRPYRKWHAAWATGDLDRAVRSTGAVPPAGRVAQRVGTSVRYPGADAVALDPDFVVVHLVGVPGGVHVDVPYRCTLAELVGSVIPSKLARLGVHAYDVRGAAHLDDGRPAQASDIWRDRPAALHWYKLRVPVSFCLPARVVRGIVKLQQLVRAGAFELV